MDETGVQPGHLLISLCGKGSALPLSYYRKLRGTLPTPLHKKLVFGVRQVLRSSHRLDEDVKSSSETCWNGKSVIFHFGFPQFPHTFPQTYQNFNFPNKTNFTVTIDFKYFPCTAILLPCLFIFPHGAYNVEMSLSRVVRLVYFSTAQGDKIIHNWHFFFSFSSETFTFSSRFF